MGKLLERRGHKVITYDSPLACPIYTSTPGSCILEESCPDIIISDVDMPRVNGIAFVEAIFRRGCKCRKFALISGKGVDEEDMERMTKLGAIFFTKPVNFRDFDLWLNAGAMPGNMSC